MIRAIVATAAIVMVVSATFIYGAIHVITEETWPDW